MRPKVLRRCHQNHAISPFFRRNFSDHGRKQGFKTSNLRESITWPVTAPPRPRLRRKQNASCTLQSAGIHIADLRRNPLPRLPDYPVRIDPIGVCETQIPRRATFLNNAGRIGFFYDCNRVGPSLRHGARKLHTLDLVKTIEKIHHTAVIAGAGKPSAHLRDFGAHQVKPQSARRDQQGRDQTSNCVDHGLSK